MEIEVNYLVQDHPANKWQNRYLHPIPILNQSPNLVSLTGLLCTINPFITLESMIHTLVHTQKSTS